DTVRVGGLDHLVVTRAAARLYDDRRPGRDGLLEAVGEGEEGVAPERGAGERDAEALRPGTRGAHGLDPRRLPAAEGERAVGGREGDGVGLDVLHDPPGEVEGAQLVASGRALRHHPRLA